VLARSPESPLGGVDPASVDASIDCNGAVQTFIWQRSIRHSGRIAYHEVVTIIIPGFFVA
jgi:hypothetical protein